eukprot:TRINITY_DN7581_c0_g1_i1.p1 TRINITY_DN7581_c0_g1~~TRINITY_DN7581_c0_g1_i1.p1  ORF type:complete len:388 (+),score=98.97 TRINITY_DN7581_c0_g1_i1:31-1194(+)
MENEQYRVIQAQILHRHGARSPTDWVPLSLRGFWRCDSRFGHASPATIAASNPDEDDDPLQKNLDISCDPGQLTPLGKFQMQEIGQKIRRLFIDEVKLLGNELNEHEVLARSTPVQRTQESLQHVFNGLYPHSKHPPINTYLSKDEPMFYDTADCSRAQEMLKVFKIANHQVLQKKGEQVKPQLKDFLNQQDHNGRRPRSDYWYLELLDLLQCYRSRTGGKLPDGVSQESMNSLEKIGVDNWFGPFRDKEMCRLGIGRYLEEIDDHIQEKIDGKSDLKLIVYAAHDTTVGPVLAALDVFDWKWPPLASNVILEVLEDKKADHFVRMTYNDRLLTIPECGTPICPYSKFKEILRKLVPKDFEQECKSKKDWEKTVEEIKRVATQTIAD